MSLPAGRKTLRRPRVPVDGRAIAKDEYNGIRAWMDAEDIRSARAFEIDRAAGIFRPGNHHGTAHRLPSDQHGTPPDERLKQKRRCQDSTSWHPQFLSLRIPFSMESRCNSHILPDSRQADHTLPMSSSQPAHTPSTLAATLTKSEYSRSTDYPATTLYI